LSKFAISIFGTLFVRQSRHRSFRQLAILAWGGYGKTTLLKHVAYMYGTQQQGKNDSGAEAHSGVAGVAEVSRPALAGKPAQLAEN
jgi:predicted NACHT family NTPase